MDLSRPDTDSMSLSSTGSDRIEISVALARGESVRIRSWREAFKSGAGRKEQVALFRAKNCRPGDLRDQQNGQR